MSATTVIISRAPAGFQVAVVPPLADRDCDMQFSDLEFARGYAQGLAGDVGWTIEDRTACMLVVEQLNHAQWHAFDPDTGWRTGVVSWAAAVADALWAAMLTNRGIESVSLDGDRLILLRRGCGV